MRKLCLALWVVVLTSTLAACETDPSFFEHPPPPTRVPAVQAAPQPGPSPPASAVSPTPAAVPEGVSYSGGDGSSVADAVVVAGVTSARASTRAEYAYLRNRYPGFRRKDQALVRSKNRYYDALTFDLPGGGSKTVYFDITGTFGKR